MELYYCVESNSRYLLIYRVTFIIQNYNSRFT